jgi:hypothetical protein
MHCEVRVCRAGVRSAERIRDPTPATRCRRRGAPGSAPPVASAVPSISGPGNAMVRRLRWVFGSVKTTPCPGTRCSPPHTDTNRDASNAPGDTRRLLQISTAVKPRLGCAGHSRGAPRSRSRSRRVVVDHPAQTAPYLLHGGSIPRALMLSTCSSRSSTNMVCSAWPALGQLLGMYRCGVAR